MAVTKKAIHFLAERIRDHEGQSDYRGTSAHTEQPTCPLAERTDGHVVPVGIPERKLRGSRVGIHVRLFFQPADESARSCQGDVIVVDPEEQEEAVSRRR